MINGALADPCHTRPSVSGLACATGPSGSVLRPESVWGPHVDSAFAWHGVLFLMEIRQSILPV